MPVGAQPYIKRTLGLACAIASAVFANSAVAQPAPKLPARAPVYAVATFTASDSPNNAGNEATLHLPDWTRLGWRPLTIAAQYSDQAVEGTRSPARPSGPCTCC